MRIGSRKIVIMAAFASLGLSECEAQAAAAATLAAVTAEAEADEVVVSATRLEESEEKSPATVTVIRSENFEERQLERVADALREVPGLSVVQTGTPGQLTSVFTRGLRSEHTQVLLDGVPLNQGLAGLFNFADLTVDNLDRIEVVRGPQSTLYGPRALAGAIQIFTKQGQGPPSTTVSTEGGSFATFRTSLQGAGAHNGFDYSVGASRFDSDFERPNNQYRRSNALLNVGWSPTETMRLSSLFAYSLADASTPHSIFAPRPIDNLLTERWLVAPHLDFTPVAWWRHKLIFSYDHERQVNDPHQDGFVGATRALFRRATVDFQNDVRATSWLTVISGYFFSTVEAGQERPFISQIFGPQPTFISDETQQHGIFAQVAVTPIDDLTLVGGGRFDHFNQFGGVWTYRFAGSYRLAPTQTTVHASLGTGFSPPSSQDKIFGNNFDLESERARGWDVGVRQKLWQRRVTLGATYFHNKLTNVIGFNGLFETLNLGAARTQGFEFEAVLEPVPSLSFRASYTYLDAEKTSEEDISQPKGSRLPRRPRHEAYLSGVYTWFGKLRTMAAVKFVNGREELSFGAPNFDIEDYVFANIGAEYEVNQHLSVYGRIENLTDERYAEVFGFPALGRGAYGGVKVMF